MPQLLPFFFTNQTLSILSLISIIIIISSKNILPEFFGSFYARNTFGTF